MQNSLQKSPKRASKLSLNKKSCKKMEPIINDEPKECFITKEYENYYELIENGSVDEELIKNGYNPQEKITIITFDKIEHTYAKCINKLGQYVYVLLENGYFFKTDKDLVYYESDSCNVNLSDKVGYLNITELQLYGIVFDCKDTLLIINRDENLNPVERTFRLKDVYNNSNLTEYFPYPIIKFNEITISSDDILEITNEINQKIRKYILEKMKNNIRSYNNNTCNYQNKVKNYCEYLEEIQSKLSDSFLLLENNYQDFVNHPPKSEKNKESYRLTKFNLYKLNESFTDYSSVIFQLYKENKIINDSLNRLNELIEYSKTEFDNIGYVKSDD